MSRPNIQFVGSIPENYDRLMGPVFFEPYARDIAARLPHGAKRVLEIACGTGIVTRALRAELPPDSRLVATDLSDAMVKYAVAHAGAPGVEFRTADACALPFASGEFDAVVCQFGMMFVSDRRMAYREAKRVLAAGGALIFSVWDGYEANPVSRIAHEVVTRIFPKDPPQFLGVPFGYHDEAAIAKELRALGFAPVTAERVRFPLRVESARDLAAGHATGTPLANALRDRKGVPIERVIDAITEDIVEAHGDHPVMASMRAIVFTAIAPTKR